MAEIADKKGKLKFTLEVEVNEELMDLTKEAMSKASSKLPEMIRHSGDR